MNKSKISAKPILKFFRELSVIVTGIIITVGFGLWVNKNNTEKDLQQYIDLIIMELEDNVIKLKSYEVWMQKSVKYAEYIQSNDKNSLNKDSLDYYRYSRTFDYSYYHLKENNDDGCGYMNISSFSHVFMTNAFEMLKNSGLMRQFKDKKLLSFILNAYNEVEFTKRTLDQIFQIKLEESMKEAQLEVERKPSVVPMQVFYSTDLPFGTANRCRYASQFLEALISELKNSKMVK